MSARAKAKRPKSVLAWALVYGKFGRISAGSIYNRRCFQPIGQDEWIRVLITPVVPRRASARRKKKA